MSQSTSSGSSTSSSTPSILPFLQQIADFSNGLAQQTYQWAQGVFQQTSQLTDQNVQSYLATSAKALDQAQHDTSRYNNLFQPLENQLVNDANTYASDARVKMNMGAAEATTGQAMDAGRQNAIRDLQAYGVDPSSGRYQELDAAQQAQKAAAQAGAGQQAQLATQATGRALRSEAIQTGERYPGQITNSLNTGLQGIQGAENAKLANANTGVALTDAAAPYVKFPPTSQTSQSKSAQGSQSSSSEKPKPPQQQQQPGQQKSSGSQGSGQTQPGGGPGYGDWSQFQPSAGGDGFQVSDPSSFIPSQFQDNGPNAMDNQGYSPFTIDPFNSGNDQGGSWGGNDPSSQIPGGYTDPGATSDVTYGTPTDFGSASDYVDTSGSNDYAEGGAIQGALPSSASPSDGEQTDDIGPLPIQGGGRAHLNADEFVIPKDVALWKGQEFFQKLIQQSRKNRVTAPAQPQQHSPQQYNQGGAI